MSTTSSVSDEHPDTAGGPVVVTGAAGFIGSHVVEAYLAERREVIGIDRRSVTDDLIAAANLGTVVANPLLRLHQAELSTAELEPLLAGADTVIHLAALPGVRDSWAPVFPGYSASNIVATQRLLVAAESVGVRRFVLASSSSVYGNTDRPSREDDPPLPLSPYGVTKLAAENLCRVHTERRDTTMTTVILRYFTVYGPRQRPGMAISKVLSAALTGERLPMYGSGDQRREFTYVADIVDATVAAAAAPDSVDGVVLNVAGRECVSLLDVIRLAVEITGNDVPVIEKPVQAGDVEVTHADHTLAQQVLGYRPKVGLREGITRQARWMADHVGVALSPESMVVIR